MKKNDLVNRSLETLADICTVAKSK